MDQMEEYAAYGLGLQATQQRIKSSPIGMLYEIEYNDIIEEPDNFNEDFKIYRNASPNDIIQLHINSEGGQLNTLVQLVNELRSTQATTIGHLKGEAHSAASMLLLQCDQHVIYPNSAMLIHEASFFVGGSGDKLFKHTDFSRRYLEACFKDFYQNFLTEEEIKEVLEGKDIWLCGDEVVERLERRVELEKAELNKVEE